MFSFSGEQLDSERCNTAVDFDRAEGCLSFGGFALVILSCLGGALAALLLFCCLGCLKKLKFFYGFGDSSLWFYSPDVMAMTF